MKTSFLLLFYFFLFWSVHSYCQLNTCKPCVIRNKIGTDLANTFNSKYRNLFGKYIDTSTSALFIHKADFLNMLDEMKHMSTSSSKVDGFRIYFAVENISSSKPKLILIFSALSGINDVPGKYFILTSNGGYTAVSSQTEIDVLKTKAQFFKNISVRNVQGVSGLPISNTYDYMYPRLWSCIDTETVRQINNTKVDRIKFGFGAYTKASTQLTNKYEQYQIMIGFSFTDEHNTDYFEDDHPENTDFGCTMPTNNQQDSTLKKLTKEYKHALSDSIKQEYLIKIEKYRASFGLDTGTPCPPNNCGYTSLY